ncbi:glycosyltransferase family 61 protein [Pistricoccus aurantiacus]|uniref:glycosyltransferase family 61 protein n=1 Tax=Pistricoccus aurantiacus TaxID=1883414 RepID=UPI00362BECAF
MKLAHRPTLRDIWRFIQRQETRLWIEPGEAAGMEWLDENAAHHFLPLEQQGAKPIVASEPDWHWSAPVSRSGLCILQNPTLLMISVNRLSPQTTNNFLACIFTRQHKRLKCTRTPRLLQYLVRDGWRHWWTSRRRRVHLKGRIAILGNQVFGGENYYHFWADAIGDFWYLNQLLPEDQRPKRYLIPFNNASWQRQILEMCDIRPEQVIPFNQHKWLTIETLVVPYRDKGAKRLSPWTAIAMQRSIGWQPSDEPNNRLIYISRKDAPRRHVVGEARIREQLLAKGFEIHTLDGLNVHEQQTLFAQAAVIFSPHGAALTNLVWCRPGTQVIDFLPERHLIPCFRELAWQSGVSYHPIVCRQVTDEEKGLDGDIEITPQQLDQALLLISHRNITTA